MKNKIILNLLLFYFFGYTAFSQNYVVQVRPAGVKEWGYANTKGELIIPAKFRKCWEFSEDGLAPTYDPDKKQFFFINLKGEILNTEITDYKLIEAFGFGLKGFDNGLVPVRQGEKWGYLNTEGKITIPIKYDKATPFNEGFAVVKNNETYIIVNKQGKEIPVDIANIDDLKPFSEQLAPYKTTTGKMGFVDVNGKIAIEAQFLSVGYFTGGLAWAKTPEKMVGFINPKGEWVIKPQFTDAKDFDPESGFARVKSAEKWVYVKKSGEVVNISISETLDDFFNGLAKGKKNEKIGFYNPKGEWVIQPQFDGARDFKNGFAAAKIGEKWGLIDKTGKWVTEPKYDDIKDVELVK
jgi:hypothetical protein